MGLEFSVNAIWGLWCGALWVLWSWGSLCNHRRITLGKSFEARISISHSFDCD